MSIYTKSENRKYGRIFKMLFLFGITHSKQYRIFGTFANLPRMSINQSETGDDGFTTYNFLAYFNLDFCI